MFIIERANERALELVADVAEVSAGALVLRHGTDVVAIFAPGQWGACRKQDSMEQRMAADLQRGAFTGDRRGVR